MSGESQIIELINRAIEAKLPLFLSEGTVVKVDKDACTCTVERDGMPTLFQCRLNAVLEAGENGMTAYPVVGSPVLCALVENDPKDTFILSATEIEEVVWHGGSNGGFCITPELKTQLDKNNQLLQGLLDILTGAPINEPGNGSPSALQTALAGVLAGKPLADFGNIENVKLKH